MKFNLALIPGDGIGPEVISSAVRVLDKISEKFGHTINYTEVCAGGASIDKYGVALTDESIAACKASDSVLLGAVGGPKWENIPNIRPEQALLGLRGALGLYANLRPALMFEELKDASPLRPDLTQNGLDILIVRELTGGIYFGKSGKSNDGNSAFDTEEYSKDEIRRILKRGIDTAYARNKRLTVVDKANVLESSRLWRSVAAEMLAGCTDLEVNYMYVDNAAMQLVRNPSQFDVIVTNNIFGDILSDEASVITGSIGMLPSASLGDSALGMYEPIHGSAPDIAGKNIANPCATILSAAMMFKYSLRLPDEHDAINSAVRKTLAQGYRTADIAAGGKFCTTTEMTEAIIENI